MKQKSNEWLRKQLIRYLDSQNAVSMSELERRIGVGKGVLSKFKKGVDTQFGYETYRKLISIIAPWENDHIVIALKIRMQLKKIGMRDDEIENILKIALYAQTHQGV